MPVIVDEVVISVQVTNSSSGSAATHAPLDERQAMVAECVERVLDVLRQKGER